MKKIIFVRHGKTTWNLAKKFQGANADSPLILSPEYLEDYTALANYLQLFKIDSIYSSPISRAKKTAELITKSHKNLQQQPINTLPELAELSFGDWEGCSKDEILAKYPTEFKSFSLRKDDPTLQAFNIENFQQARLRFCNGIKKITTNLVDGQTALVVSHGAISQLGIKQLTTNENLGGLANLSLSVCTLRNEKYLLERYNETGFLKHPIIAQENTSIL